MGIAYICEFSRFGTRPRGGVSLGSFSAASSEVCPPGKGLSLMLEVHNLDWSGEPSQSGRENDDARTLLSGPFEDLTEAIARRGDNLTQSETVRRVLYAYQQAHRAARELGTNASLLTALWIERSLTIASVGVCKCYLIREKRINQLNTNDYNRMTIDGVTHTSSSVLSNILGMGRIESTDDLHLIQVDLEGGDLIVLASECLHQSISEQEITLETVQNGELGRVCRSLSEKAIERSDPSVPLALSVIKFQSQPARG